MDCLRLKKQRLIINISFIPRPYSHHKIIPSPLTQPWMILWEWESPHLCPWQTAVTLLFHRNASIRDHSAWSLSASASFALHDPWGPVQFCFLGSDGRHSQQHCTVLMDRSWATKRKVVKGYSPLWSTFRLYDSKHPSEVSEWTKSMPVYNTKKQGQMEMHVYFIRNRQTVFQSGCFFSHSYQQYPRTLAFPPPCFQIGYYRLLSKSYCVLWSVSG